MRRRITGNARICVDAPGAAQILIFFIDAEICEAGFHKTHGDQYAGHAGTDNQNFRTLGAAITLPRKYHRRRCRHQFAHSADRNDII